MAPSSLTVAFLITQFALLAIVYVGIVMLRMGEKSFSPYSSNPRPATKHLPSRVFAFSLLTLACLVFSDDLVVISKPAFADVTFPSFSRETAFLIVFIFDIVGAGFLMGMTGGSKDSPFSAVLFALPSLAIFLREPPAWYFIYTALAVIFFLVFRRNNSAGSAIIENPRHLAAFQVVTLGCLALSTLIGYVTRPGG